MFIRALNLPTVVVALLIVFGPEALAQRRGAPTAVQPATPAPHPDSTIVVTSLFLRRDAVLKITQQLAAADKRKPEVGILGSIKKTVGGDHHQVDAAKQVLVQQALTLGSDGRTVIVVIGTEADSTKVQESLSGVKRKIRLAFVNRDFADDTNDNTVLKAGMAGAVTDAGTNLWVFLPRKGSAKRDKADRVLSTKVAAPTLWNGLFASDGDAIDVNQLKSLIPKRDTTSHPVTAVAASAVTSDSPAPASGSPAVGDVVVPKIASVKVLAEPSSNSKVLGTVQKSDELVVTSAAQNGFIKVEGATLSGWVNVLLVVKR